MRCTPSVSTSSLRLRLGWACCAWTVLVWSKGGHVRRSLFCVRKSRCRVRPSLPSLLLRGAWVTVPNTYDQNLPLIIQLKKRRGPCNLPLFLVYRSGWLKLSSVWSLNSRRVFQGSKNQKMAASDPAFVRRVKRSAGREDRSELSKWLQMVYVMTK